MHFLIFFESSLTEVETITFQFIVYAKINYMTTQSTEVIYGIIYLFFSHEASEYSLYVEE